MTVDRVRERPGGRSAEVRRRVLDALGGLLADHPGQTPSIADVALRSGVSRSTVHRRWGNLDALLADLALDGITPPEVGRAARRGDLRSWASATADALNQSPPGQSGFARVIGYMGRLRTVEERQEIGLELLRRMAPLDGASADEPYRVLDLVEVVFAPMYLQHLMGTSPITARDVDRLCTRFENLPAADRHRPSGR